MSGRLANDYNKCVFINCPFDTEYKDLFYSIVFTVYFCGYLPRCALEASNSDDIRIKKILSLIGQCRWGIHDISRTEMNASGLPRFNMPLELGMFLGSQHFGSKPHRLKSCIIMDTSQYRYQQFISDIAGQDITCHNGRKEDAVSAIRDWLSSLDKKSIMPGGKNIIARFMEFNSDLPSMCRDLKLEVEEIKYVDYTSLVSTWLKTRL